MSDKYIKEITQNIPNNELNAAYDALMNSNLNKTSDYEEISMEELNEYIEGLECQAEDLRKQLAKANERVAELERFQAEVAYRCFIAGLNTEKPREPNAENETATAINHFAVTVDRYAISTSRSILEQLRKEQE